MSSFEYYQHVKNIFMDHHDCMGLNEEESDDLFNSAPFYQIENWLKKNGYDFVLSEGDEF